MRPTPASTLLGWAVVGGALGWAVHPVAESGGKVPPLVGASQPLALAFLAAVLGYVAWATHRAVHVRRDLEPQRAVNRLVLGRASALVGALATGGYLGYAASWLGDSAEQADDRMVGSVITAACAWVAMVAALLLERACRVRRPPTAGRSG